MDPLTAGIALSEEITQEGYTVSYLEWPGPIEDIHHDRARVRYTPSGKPAVDTIERLADEAGIHIPTIIVKNGWFTIIHPLPDSPWDMSIQNIFCQAMEEQEVFLH